MLRIVIGIADGSIPVWEIVDEKLMVNQLVWPRIRGRIDGVEWVDSGGYQYMVHGTVIDIDELIKRYCEIPSRYYVMLDNPPRSFPGDTLDRNIELFEKLYTRYECSGEIVPVIHFYYPITRIIEAAEYYSQYTRIVGYGGIVPPLLRKTSLRVPSLAGLLLLRRVWRGHIHVLGAGSPVMLYLVSYLGADTADTSTWRVKAAYGNILVPGAGERNVSRAKTWRSPRATAEDLEKLYSFLEKTGFPYIDRAEEMLRSFRGRALINLWIITHIDIDTWGPGGFRWIHRKLQYLEQLGVEELVEEIDVIVKRLVVKNN